MSTFRLLLAGSALSLPVFLDVSALCSNDEQDPPRVPRTRRCLTLNVNTGQDFIFHALDEGEKSKIDYRMVVQDVAADGDIKIAVAGFHQRAGEESPLAQARAHGTILTLTRAGRLKHIDEDLTIPRGFETHLRLVFGFGIHARPLEERHLYRVEPLLPPAANSEDIHLRFEGLVKDEDQELARFTVLEGYGVAEEHGPAQPQAPRHLRVVDAGEATPAPERVSVAASPAEWTAVGEATYRTADGVLEAARLTGRSADQQANRPELAQLSLRRVSIGRAEKSSPGTGGHWSVR